MKVRHRPIPRTPEDRRKRRKRERDAAGSLRVDVPEVVMDALLEARPTLKAELADVRQGLAVFCSLAHLSRRRHRDHPGWFWVKFLELEGRFGRDEFARLNTLHEICEISHGWSAGKTTKAYKLHEDISTVIDKRSMELVRSSDGMTRLVRPDGKIARRLRQPSLTRNFRGLPASLLGNARLLEYVSVDLDALGLLDNLLAQAEGEEGPERRHALSELGLNADVCISDLRATLTSVRLNARIDIVGRGLIAHEYVMAKIGGRLFARGVNLQSAPKIIKRFALNGFYEYDFSNCHLNVFVRLAEPLGIDLPAVRGYLANKKAMRQQIADRVGITVDEAKQCILALTYGAAMSVDPEKTIPSLIGKEAALRLYGDPSFRPLYSELKKGRTAILKSCPRWRGAIYNALELPLSVSAPRKAQLLAHILQGVESQALLAILRAYPEDIVLLQHDGFVSRCPLDIGGLEQLVLEATGFVMRLGVEQLELPVASSPATRISAK